MSSLAPFFIDSFFLFVWLYCGSGSNIASLLGCHMKFHKEHYQKNEEFVGYCKGMYSNSTSTTWISRKMSDCITTLYILMAFCWNVCAACALIFPSVSDEVLLSFVVNKDAQAAKELLLLAASPAEQQKWIQRMSKKVSKARLTGLV